MEFEWDPAKRARNLAKHGVDFVRAVAIFEGLTAEWPDTRREYGEERVVAVGEAGGRILTVIYTYRGKAVRIISARRAREHEKAAYRAIHSRETERPN